MNLAFRGRPSKGCNRCRQRKVKCDEGQPRCDRCTKGGLECVYRNEFDLLLRNQTSETAAKAQRKWRSRVRKSDDRSTHSPSSPSSSSSSAESPQHKIEVNLDQSIYDLAARRFVFDFVVAEGQQVPKTGFATFVPKLVQNLEPGTCIYHAFRATSLSNFAARGKSLQAADMASKEYGKTIKLLGPYVSNPDSAPPLQTLAAVCLLGLYEILSTPYLTHGGSWQAHVNGAVAILNSVYERGGENIEPLSELFQHIITQMLINRMTFGRAPSIPMSTVNAFIRPKTMASQVLVLMYKTAYAMSDWKTTEMDGAEHSSLLSAARKMVKDCGDIDAEFDQWLAERAPIWEEETKAMKVDELPVYLRDLFSLPGAPTTLRVSSNLLIAQRYQMTRGTRIQLHAHALNAVDVLIANASTDAQLASWLETQRRFEVRILDLTDALLSSIYGHLTLPIRGKPVAKTLDDLPSLRFFMLLWPLYRSGMAIARRETLQRLDTKGCRLWIRSLFCWIRDDIGIRKCEGLVDNIDGKFGLTFY